MPPNAPTPMENQPHHLPILIAVILIAFSFNPASGQVCLGNLTSRADVQELTLGNDYNVYYTRDMGSPDFFPVANAGWVRDALFNSHHVFVTTNGFRNPNFNSARNNICISAAVGCFADAPRDRIRLQAPCMARLSEPSTRSVVNHELFHHVQYSYIFFSTWPSWGKWTIEGTPSAMEDRSFRDVDNNAMNSRYVGDVNRFLGTPNTTLMNRSYDAALFWNYLAEQFGTVTKEPGRGVDVIRRFWECAGRNSPDSIHCVRETIQAAVPGRTLEDVWIDFAIANFTHNLNLARLTEAQQKRYSYEDESGAGGGTPYGNVARANVTSFNTTLSSSVVRWGAQYFVAKVPASDCEAVGFWGKARGNQRLGWALVALRSSDCVTEIARGIGNVFYKSFLNYPEAPVTQMVLIVVGFNDAASFDYAAGSGQIGGAILLPTMDRPAFVGRRDNPRRFQVRLRVDGPAVLTPAGSGLISLRGLNPALFRIVLRSASTGAAYEARTVNSAYVSGEYWVVVAAPEITSPADGDIYDLEICVCVAGLDCALLLTKPRAVKYGEVQFNQMLVLDRSFSMHYPELAENSKIQAAKNAARLFADAAADADRVGFVTFTGDNGECSLDAAVNRPLLRMNNLGTDNRGPLIAAINGVVEGGWTSIGDGLKVGRDTLLSAAPPPGPGDVNGLVLLSDGLENEGDFWEMANVSCSSPAVRDSFHPVSGSARSIKIDTIAFGPNTDQELLQRIAIFTRGFYYAVNIDPPAGLAAGAARAVAGPGTAPPTMSSLQVPNRLAHVYRSVQEDLHGHDRLHFRSHPLSAGANSFVVPVTEHMDGGVQEASFTFNWDLASVTVQVRLFDPLGNEITGATPSWTVLPDASHKVYQFNGTLPPGDYVVTANASGNVQLLAMVSGKLIRGVDFDVYLSQPPALPPTPGCDFPRPYDYLRGLPVEIAANVQDHQGGIGGLQMVALIENPNGSVNRLSLYDDGLHDNGIEGDGIYGNVYTRTPFFSRGGVADFPGLPAGQWGNYTVHVVAQGKAHSGDTFERSGQRFFHVYEYEETPQFSECDPDMDNDGIPDRWEDLYRLDKGDPSDALLDFDADGLNNRDEFNFGTLPFNADTDAGGEADGSEVAQGRDPLYDKDDLLPAIIDYGLVTHRFHVPIHEPETNAAILHFPVNAAYRFMEIWRYDSGDPAFHLETRVDLSVEQSGVYHDRGLLPGVPYYYYLVAEGHSGARTAQTPFFFTVPKADPDPPEGAIFIENGATFTATLNVQVQLTADPDAVEVMLSQDPTFAGASYQPMAPEVLFTLTPLGAGPAVVTVYAMFRDASLNESVVVHDSILVDVGGDADGDGLYDPWEFEYFGSLVGTPVGDDDGDGLSNLEEFRNGTGPTDPASPGRANVRSIGLEGGDVIIEYRGTLKCSERVEGPYMLVDGAMSPYRIAPADRTRFFIAE